MAVAAPARKTAPAPAPSRTSPPRRKKAAAAPAPARRAPARKAGAAAPARQVPPRRAPARRAPAKAPARRPRPKPGRQARGQLIPLAVGRTAVAVRQLPDSGLVLRMTRGRAWIGVLGMLLVGIVALNVITLSFAASTGGIDQEITALDQENSILRSRDATRSSIGRVGADAAALGLVTPSSADTIFAESSHDDVATAAARLAAAGSG